MTVRPRRPKGLNVPKARKGVFLSWRKWRPPLPPPALPCLCRPAWKEAGAKTPLSPFLCVSQGDQWKVHPEPTRPHAKLACTRKFQGNANPRNPQMPMGWPPCRAITAFLQCCLFSGVVLFWHPAADHAFCFPKSTAPLKSPPLNVPRPLSPHQFLLNRGPGMKAGITFTARRNAPPSATFSHQHPFFFSILSLPETRLPGLGLHPHGTP